MTRLLPLLTLLASLVPTAVHADVASDRVYLITGATGCPTGQSSFKRIRQNPDGSGTTETAEFQVPTGKYLEVTSVEYSFPQFTAYAKSYVQSLDLYVRQRTGTAGSIIFGATYANTPVFDADENGNLATFGEYTGPGPETRVAAFPSGPLVSTAGRLCLSAVSSFHTYGGRVRIRGRLITADATIIGGGVIVAGP